MTTAVAPDAPTSGTTENYEVATKLFNEQFVSIQPEEYIQFLAVNDEESNAIREYYMDLFQWDPNLLKSTRSLCAKLYLKGESQEIDRILTSFTQSYIKQNPVNVFCTKNFENIYIVLYSLILLNTSLHNAEVNKKSKISQSDYIRNTFTTFIQQDPKLSKKLSIKQRITIERELGNYYEDLSKNELHLKTNVDDKLARIQPITKDSSKGVATTDEKIPNSSSTDKIDDLNLSRQVSGSSIWSSDTNKRNSLSMKRMSSATSSISQFTITNGSRNNNRVGFTRALVSDQNQRFYQQGNSSMVSNGTYGTVRNRQSIRGINGSGLNGAAVNRSSRASIVSRESLATNNDDSMSVVSFESADLDKINLVDPQQQQQQVTQLENFNVDQFQDNFDLTLELQGSPYLKEGLLKLKILNNDQQDNNLPDSTISSGTSSVSTASSTSSRFFSFFSRSSRGNNSESSSLNATSNSVLNNKFVEYFVVVSKGEMNLYSFDPKVVKRHQQKLKKFKQKQQKNLINLDFLNDDDDISTFNDSTEDVGDGNWLKNAANVGNYNLCSAFSQLEKSSLYIKKTSGYIFTLTFPKTSKKPNKKFVFEAGTKEIALEFINTCNFWASKITAIPTFEESVSSIEYGWNDLDQLIGNKANFKKLKSIQKWEPLPQGLYLSTYNYDTSENHYNMMKQFIKTLNYYHNLKKLFKEFNELRIKFIKNFSSQASSSNFLRIQANYESKLLDYKFELKKYKNYLIILGFALQLRFDLEDEEKDREQLEIDLEKDSDNVEFSDTVNDTTVIASSKSSSDNSNDDVDEEDNDEESELSRLVKYEIRKLFIGLKDVGKIIPTFQTSKSISNLNELQSQIPNLTASDFNNSFSLVKSPKTYTLSNYKDNESPINQLLQSQKPKEIVHSFSHNTIKEEDEPEAN